MRLPRPAALGLRFAISASCDVRKENSQLFADLIVSSAAQTLLKLNDHIQPAKLQLNGPKNFSREALAAIPFHRPLEHSLRGDDPKPRMRQAVRSAANHAYFARSFPAVSKDCLKLLGPA